MSVTSQAVARAARIILRRTLTTAEAFDLASASNLSGLVEKLLAFDEVKGLGDGDKAIRAYDAVIDRYDPAPPSTAQHWRDTIEVGDLTLAGLVDAFAQYADSGYRHDPCAAPITAMVRTARTDDGETLIVSLGSNHRLYLFWPQAGGWSQHDLSAAIPKPANGHVQSFDLGQQADGSISLGFAVAPRRGQAVSSVYAVAGLPASGDPGAWASAIGALTPLPTAPEGLIVSAVTLQPGAGAPKLIVGGAVAGAMNSYFVDTSTPAGPWTLVRLPEDGTAIHGYAMTSGGRHGLLALYDIGGSTALTLTTDPDAYGKSINLSYLGLPARATSLAVIDSGGTVPTVFVGGDGLVCYPVGNHDSPTAVAGGIGLSILAATTTSISYSDADGALWRGTLQDGAGWVVEKVGSALGGALVAAPDGPAGQKRFLVLLPDGTAHLAEGRGDGTASMLEVTQHAVWPEQPLTAEQLHSAAAAALPVVHLYDAETFLPSSVDFYLRKVGVWDQVRSAWQTQPGAVWDDQANDMAAAALVFGPRSAVGTPQHDCDFNLRIPDDQLATLRLGALQTAPFYLHAKFAPDENATHLVVWIFYPYNGPGTLNLEVAGSSSHIDLDPMGTHEGDWEHFTIAIDNDTMSPTKIYLSAHDGGDWVTLDAFGRDPGSGRLLVYASRNGHAAYPKDGDNPFHGKSGTFMGQTVWSFALINQCNAGPTLDPSRFQFISAPCLGDQAPPEPRWLRFAWRWGRFTQFTPQDISNVITRALGPVGDVPFLSDIGDAIGSEVIPALGGDGNAAGPGALRYKDNWWGSE